MAYASFTLPLPWFAIFILIEVISQIVQVESCRRDPDFIASERWDDRAAYSIMIVCMVFLTLRCFLFELNSIKLFKDNKLLVALSKEKLLFVDFLCKDMKAPLQLITGSIEHFNGSMIRSININDEGTMYIQQMIRCAQQVVSYKSFIIQFIIIFMFVTAYVQYVVR